MKISFYLQKKEKTNGRSEELYVANVLRNICLIMIITTFEWALINEYLMINEL